MTESHRFPEFYGTLVFYRHQEFDLLDFIFREEIDGVLNQGLADTAAPVFLHDEEVADKTEFIQFEIFRFLGNVGIAKTYQFAIGVRDPQGNPMIDYSGNIIARQGRGAKSIPLAVNDPTGKWTITVQDMLSGQTVTRELNVE